MFANTNINKYIIDQRLTKMDSIVQQKVIFVGQPWAYINDLTI